MFYLVSETKYVTYGLNCAYSFQLYAWQYTGITQKPMTIYHKRRGSLVLPILGQKWLKIKKRGFRVSLNPNMLPVS